MSTPSLSGPDFECPEYTTRSFGIPELTACPTGNESEDHSPASGAVTVFSPQGSPLGRSSHPSGNLRSADPHESASFPEKIFPVFQFLNSVSALSGQSQETEVNEMRRTPMNILVVSFLLTKPVLIPAGPAEVSSTTSRSQLTIRILDLAQVGGETLNRAKAVVEGSFKPMGIQLTWLHCAVGEAPEGVACSAPVEPNDISLRILQRNRKSFSKTRHSMAGVAIPLGSGGSKGIIYVFFDRILEVKENQKIPMELALGVAIAHEIGHLLLPGQRHAQAGIMRGKLESKDWQLASQGRLSFTARQREIIMAGMQTPNPGQNTNSDNRLAFLSIPTHGL
jgi:hypothetical protein